MFSVTEVTNLIIAIPLNTLLVILSLLAFSLFHIYYVKYRSYVTPGYLLCLGLPSLVFISYTHGNNIGLYEVVLGVVLSAIVYFVCVMYGSIWRGMFMGYQLAGKIDFTTENSFRKTYLSFISGQTDNRTKLLYTYSMVDSNVFNSNYSSVLLSELDLIINDVTRTQDKKLKKLIENKLAANIEL